MQTLPLDALCNYRFLSEPHWAPGGRHAAFVAGWANGQNGYDASIYVYDHAARAVRRLTGLGGEKSFVWLDGEHLLFPAVRSEAIKKQQEEGAELTAYYRIRIAGGEAEESFTVPLRVNALKPAAQGYMVLSAVFDPQKPDLSALPAEQREQAMKARKEDQDYQMIDELPWWGNGLGFTNRKRARLYLYHTESRALTPITGPDFQTEGFCVSPDGGRVLYYGAPFAAGVYRRKNAVYCHDIASGHTQKLMEPDYVVSQADFLDANTVILAASDQKRYGLNENPFFYTLDISTGKLSLLLPCDGSVCGGLTTDCRLGGGTTYKTFDGALYFTGVSGHDACLNRLDGGGVRCAVGGPGSVDCFDICESGILYVGLRGLRLQELYLWDVNLGREIRLTGMNESIQDSYALSKPEHLSFTDADGFVVDGWVMRPAGYVPGSAYPAILNIHGGPKGAFGDIFFHEMQYWAGQGYFVLYCNPRGSSGKGNAFAELRGAYGTYDYDDLMRFTDLCLERYPDIDQARLGVTGGSYGGFMTNWIIGHTSRFKAAASQRSISNWISFAGTSDIGYLFAEDQIAASVEDAPEKLWWHSPLRCARRAVTPTLFIHSDEDYRCWIAEGYQMFTALRKRGVDTRMCVFHGENHELSRSGKPQHRLRRLSEITAWFDQRLKPR